MKKITVCPSCLNVCFWLVSAYKIKTSFKNKVQHDMRFVTNRQVIQLLSGKYIALNFPEIGLSGFKPSSVTVAILLYACVCEYYIKFGKPLS